LTQSLNSTSDLHNGYRELDFPEQPPEGLNPDWRRKTVRTWPWVTPIAPRNISIFHSCQEIFWV